MLQVPLKQEQVEAACRLHERLTQWRLSDDALRRLRDRIPGFDSEACLLKSVSVNTLYGTQVLAIVRMASHVSNALGSLPTYETDPELVERIAALPAADGYRKLRFISFAAKFCHFFIDQERFPIYDEAAREAIKLHLGPASVTEDDRRPYQAFCTNLGRLRTEAQITGAGRHLDRYLWITGMYMKWLKVRGKPKQLMNVELRGLFENPPPNAAPELDALLPSTLKRALKREL